MDHVAAPADLERFVDQQYGQVFATLVVMCGDRATAQELTQEAFTRVCQHWERVRHMDAPGAWVHRVAVNLALSRRRQRRTEYRLDARLRAAPALQAIAADGSGPDTSAVQAALSGLAIEERAVLALRFLADLSVADTVAVLDVPEGTVKTRTRRGLAALRASGLLTEKEPAE